MDFYVVKPDVEHEGEVTRDGYSGDDARYWVEPGGVLVAGGFNDDSFRRWRVYAPGTWLQVESDQAPARPGELPSGTAPGSGASGLQFT
uniref:Uncharacterized protein n=2 Tax=unclassified Mycobacterium TaxID=2642494 RepID=A0A5Q5BSM2_MYCSS